jgi:hypothetical protein
MHRSLSALPSQRDLLDTASNAILTTSAGKTVSGGTSMAKKAKKAKKAKSAVKKTAKKAKRTGGTGPRKK